MTVSFAFLSVTVSLMRLTLVYLVPESLHLLDGLVVRHFEQLGVKMLIRSDPIESSTDSTVRKMVSSFGASLVVHSCPWILHAGHPPTD